MRDVRQVCVYCASSTRTVPAQRQAAFDLGRHLAAAGITIVYGGGAIGSMGALADGALASGGHVIGVLPEFMAELEWAHPRVSELVVVTDMHARKRRMLEGVDGVLALPGGCGTLEELLEAITWKRLGLHFAPIVLVNVGGFYDPLVTQLERAIAEGFMDPRHGAMWQVVDAPAQALAALKDGPEWPRDARSFSVPGGPSGK